MRKQFSKKNVDAKDKEKKDKKPTKLPRELTEEEKEERQERARAKEKSELVAKAMSQEHYLDKFEKEAFNELTTKQMNYFAFETNMRTKICEIVTPYVDHAVKDRESFGEMQYTQKDIQKRLLWIEGVFEEGKGKNVVFDRIMETMVNSEVDRLKFTSYV